MTIDNQGMVKYEPGDIVTVRSEPVLTPKILWGGGMDRWCGKNLTIKCVARFAGFYRYTVEENRYTWINDFFLPCCFSVCEDADDIGESTFDELKSFLKDFAIINS